MRYEAPLHYRPAMLRKAVFAYWRRSTGLMFGAAILYVAAGLAWLLWRGDRSWVVGVVATSLFMGIAFSAAVYVLNLRNTLRKLRDMGQPQATLVAEETSFSLVSGTGSSTLAWSSVGKVWCYDDFWLLMFAPSQFVTLPLADMEADMQAFVLSRIEAAGGNIQK
jgi:YcxB-like protein